MPNAFDVDDRRAPIGRSSVRHVQGAHHGHEIAIAGGAT